MSLAAFLLFIYMVFSLMFEFMNFTLAESFMFIINLYLTTADAVVYNTPIS